MKNILLSIVFLFVLTWCGTETVKTVDLVTWEIMEGKVDKKIDLVAKWMTWSITDIFDNDPKKILEVKVKSAESVWKELKQEFGDPYVAQNEFVKIRTEVNNVWKTAFDTNSWVWVTAWRIKFINSEWYEYNVSSDYISTPESEWWYFDLNPWQKWIKDYYFDADPWILEDGILRFEKRNIDFLLK